MVAANWPIRSRDLLLLCYNNSWFLVTFIENFAPKVEVWSLLDWKKVQECDYVFGFVDDVPEKKGMDLWTQMSSSKCSFTCICGIFWPLNPSTTTVYARSAFHPSLRFTLSLQSAFYTQSAVRVLHWPMKKCIHKIKNMPLHGLWANLFSFPVKSSV